MYVTLNVTFLFCYPFQKNKFLRPRNFFSFKFHNKMKRPLLRYVSLKAVIDLPLYIKSQPCVAVLYVISTKCHTKTSNSL